MQRRRFITLFCGTAATWPLATRAQQRVVPMIGFLSRASREAYAVRLRAFASGLKEEGYIEGHNVEIEYRWADDHDDRLPVLAAELIHRQAMVIVAGGSSASKVAKTATTTIPIVFETASDPVTLGLVASINRHGGNLTGVTNLNVEVGQKRLELLRELLPAARIIAVLVDPSDAPILTEEFLHIMQAAAAALGMELHVLNASTDRDLDTVFATLRADALVIGPYLFFTSRFERLGALSLLHAVPAIFSNRPFVAAGGLISYGGDEKETYRLVGLYAGKILKGSNPGDLPVQRATKVELIINLKTAKSLGIAVPLALSGRADELIE
jgi:putative tryptophan/tyrosine transport system substrate-binding protein